MKGVLRRRQLLQFIGLSNTTQWRMEKNGEFPSRIKLGRGAVGWRLDEVEEWLNGRERVPRQKLGMS
jgi:prophage regulatory protein